MKVARRLLAYLLEESPRLLAVAAATGVVQSALLIPIALLVRNVFDTAIPGHDVSAIIASGAALVALYAASALLGYLSLRTSLRLTAGVANRLRIDVLAKLYALPQRWHDRQRAGEVQSLAVQDTERVEWMLADVASLVAPAVLVGLVLLVACLVVSPLLFAVVVAAVGPLMLAVAALARRAHRKVVEWGQSSQRYSAETQVRVRALGLTKVAGAEASELDSATHGARDLTERYQSFQRARAANAAVDASVAAVAGALVLVVGGIAVANHATTLGGLLAFYAVL